MAEPEEESLLGIPLECRKLIYRHAFGTRTAVIRRDEWTKKSTGWNNGNDWGEPATTTTSKWCAYIEHESRSSQLLRTCHSIHEEAKEVLMEATTFHVNPGIVMPDCLRSPALVYHLVLELGVDDLESIPDQVMSKMDLENLLDVKISCTAPEWLYPSTFAHRMGGRTDYYEAYKRVRSLAGYMLVDSNLNKLSDESVPGRQICFKLKIVQRTTRRKNKVCRSVSVCEHQTYNEQDQYEIEIFP